MNCLSTATCRDCKAWKSKVSRSRTRLKVLDDSSARWISSFCYGNCPTTLYRDCKDLASITHFQPSTGCTIYYLDVKRVRRWCWSILWVKINMVSGCINSNVSACHLWTLWWIDLIGSTAKRATVVIPLYLIDPHSRVNINYEGNFSVCQFWCPLWDHGRKITACSSMKQYW